MRHIALALALLASAAPIATTAQESSLTSINNATDKARIKPRDAGWQGATQNFLYASGGLYQVTTAVGKVTDIALQEGEQLSDTGAVAAGDTARWVIGEATSGGGPTRRTHILVKPTDPGLVTNLVINTNRRTYYVELRSTQSSYMASARWSYPQDGLIALQAKAEQAAQVAATQVATDIDPQKLNFDYRISGHRPPWRPSQLFDDGRKTYILFPAATAQSELPPLFLIGDDGKAELVNYRVTDRMMIVDRLFTRAELRIGTKKQQIVRIDRVAAQRPKS
ncbi:type IV secretion system protein VirB9 [Sphingopyxis sp. YR583]|uniref:P-type conjugative transfer protein TrbG n=1 Tax=Sphingopyxis sp. YR583 TaxID=1881047 RepID=UPI0008A751CB|nr:P-type conjugative transfer protein TrbG [Sphingopyxis sp. YR583]SEH15005.1 type IV secretion system protein VirB9 [Sphingopyxis sp. YR583]